MDLSFVIVPQHHSQVPCTFNLEYLLPCQRQSACEFPETLTHPFLVPCSSLTNIMVGFIYSTTIVPTLRPLMRAALSSSREEKTMDTTDGMQMTRLQTGTLENRAVL